MLELRSPLHSSGGVLAWVVVHVEDLEEGSKISSAESAISF